MTRYKPKVDEETNHEYYNKLRKLEEEDAPIVCPTCYGTGTHIDYKSRLASMCLNCEGLGVIYE